MRILRGSLLLIALDGAFAAGALAQAIPIAPPEIVRVCPGAFPTDLTKTDCRYTPKQRSLDFVTGFVTDQAGLGAVVYGLGAQIIQSPPEWKRTWYGYGQRVGVRYTQAVGKGAAQVLSGFILNDDPRFLAYADDPTVIRRRQQAVKGLSGGDRTLDQMTHDGWQRFGHAWYDVITVRRSSRNGDGHRMPAISRFAGEFAGAYVGYPWYPARENDFASVGQRAAGAFGTAVLSSFWNEYHVEITNLLLHRNQTPTVAGGNP